MHQYRQRPHPTPRIQRPQGEGVTHGQRHGNRPSHRNPVILLYVCTSYSSVSAIVLSAAGLLLWYYCFMCVYFLMLAGLLVFCSPITPAKPNQDGSSGRQPNGTRAEKNTLDSVTDTAKPKTAWLLLIYQCFVLIKSCYRLKSSYYLLPKSSYILLK